ncbi:MMPL family transporter [Shewanella sp.]|uniref:efflux RND transporter permease subunit n=1 Tax=Shewanella sp. TaxID=50422 RepID=UPI00262412E7|nr:MMPL family transporter [Shewanella sp.]
MTISSQPNTGPVNLLDKNSGNLVERVVFNHRLLFLILVTVMTLCMAGIVSQRLTLKPSFDKMLPQGHPYIQNFLAERSQLRGLGNSLRVVVENPQGDIFDPLYLDTLKQINDTLFLTDGVDRAWMKSLWSPGVRWTEVTEEGFQGGPVMPDRYDGSDTSIGQLRQNIARAGIVGNLVANDFRSTMIMVPLLDRQSATGEPVDYGQLADVIAQLREQYEKPDGSGAVKIHVIGFAQLIGELIGGLHQMAGFFAIAIIIALCIIWAYSRCFRSSLLVVSCSLLAVLWQLGIISLLDYPLDPYTILVPFLTFAIGVSHATQKMNSVMRDIGNGMDKLTAARLTFRRLFIPGLTALLSDTVGFAVLMLINIPVIQDLAITASIGVAMLIFTTLLLIPVSLSYVGVSRKAALRYLKSERVTLEHKGLGRLWDYLDRFTLRRYATFALVFSTLLTAGGYLVSRNIQVGDLDAGAPELRADSRYNRDNAYITEHYALSSDLFAVMIKTAPEGCLDYQTLILADKLAWQLQQNPNVQMTNSLVDAVKQISAGAYEGNLKFYSILRNQDMLNYAAQQASVNNPELFNTDCSLMPVIAYLKDHKAKTLEAVSQVAQQFADEHSNDKVQFLLAAGSAGIDAATNQVVKEANTAMLLYVYAGVAIFCLITFRSWRATLIALLPLMMTSILCEALMVMLGIGIKVATLPVIALGVGIGIDYAIYLLSIQLQFQRQGQSLTDAYRNAVTFTGKVVALVGVTLAAGVITWLASPIKFQADMGLLLTFMFIWNMLGALILIPALSHFMLPKMHKDGPAQGAKTVSPQQDHQLSRTEKLMASNEKRELL